MKDRRSSSSTSPSSAVASSSMRSESFRIRSTTRPRRLDGARISVPHAEMSSAGVIIDVRIASASVSEPISTTLPNTLVRSSPYVEQFDLEDQHGIRWNHTAGAASPVAEVGRDDQLALAAN